MKNKHATGKNGWSLPADIKTDDLKQLQKGYAVSSLRGYYKIHIPKG